MTFPQLIKKFLLFIFLPIALVVLVVGYLAIFQPGLNSYEEGEIHDEIEVDVEKEMKSGAETNGVKEPVTITAPGESYITFVNSEGIGNIAVRVSVPEEARYEEGIPVIISTPTFFTDKDAFEYLLNPMAEGFLMVSLLYPGRLDRETGVSSEGENDYGGALTRQAFRDVILYALGEKTDVNGAYLDEHVTDEILYDNVGLYAFSHPGIMATNVMSHYPDELKNVAYFVGRENPTVDAISCMEIGYYADNGDEIRNPNYHYPSSYGSDDLSINYDTVRWATKWEQPYFDDNGNGSYDEGVEYILPSFGPSMFEERYYSVELLEALAKNEPSYAEYGIPGVVDVETAREIWAERESADQYQYFNVLADSFRVMLVIGAEDHVQPTSDKPHVHMAFDGFTAAGVWTRINPDMAYAEAAGGRFAKNYTEIAANTEPADWKQGDIYGHPGFGGATTIYPLAAMQEMADRTQFNVWEDDLSEVIE